ncbi:uroporphyrinogen decarboxylase family protein [Bacteroides sp.]|uniref:uroporphyrinogen decarboxylase family protein n=1 Tax=Bacteroides sp. TaxID=29523 RepID=UPI00263506FF|nr:uroporphyrinogen decarboxylase family protein [Bacteroides sp.]MDD3037121.1 uroporphyrinogen decarboxylase family protein [Bacteroides sp.]
MNIDKWINDIITTRERCTIPIMTHPGIEMIGATVKDAVQNGKIHAQAINELSNKYPSKAATVIMDLTVEAEAFGSAIAFPENDMPHILGSLVDSAGIQGLQIPSLSSGRISEYITANKMAVEMITDKPVFAGVIGPFSLAGRLYGMSEIMVACYLEPDTIALLLEKCSRFIEMYCMELKRTGCSGVIIAEPAAGLLSNEDCLQFSSVYIKSVIDHVQDESFMVTLHNCGNIGQCTDAMLYTGAKAYHFGNAISMIEALKQSPADVLVMGNINPVAVLRMMSPEQIEKEVLSLLEQTAESPNFVLSTGCDVPPCVPAENIQAYYNALSVFNSRI